MLKPYESFIFKIAIIKIEILTKEYKLSRTISLFSIAGHNFHLVSSDSFIFKLKCAIFYYECPDIVTKSVCMQMSL